MKKNIRSIRTSMTRDLRQLMTLIRAEDGEFGISSVIGIAIGLIVAAFILIPGIETFATRIMTDMLSWWTNSVGSQIFPN